MFSQKTHIKGSVDFNGIYTNQLAFVSFDTSLILCIYKLLSNLKTFWSHTSKIAVLIREFLAKTTYLYWVLFPGSVNGFTGHSDWLKESWLTATLPVCIVWPNTSESKAPWHLLLDMSIRHDNSHCGWSLLDLVTISRNHTDAGSIESKLSLNFTICVHFSQKSRLCQWRWILDTQHT